MATYTSFRDGGKTDEIGISRMTSKVWQGNIIEGLDVTQANPVGMEVTITPGDLKLDHLSSCYTSWSDSDTPLAIATADQSNPRIDRVVAYIDTYETPSAENANNPELLKFVVVTGIASAAPVRPSDTAVQNTITPGNPWCDLANVTVAAGVTQITNANITDTRQGLHIDHPFISPRTLQGTMTAGNIGTAGRNFDVTINSDLLPGTGTYLVKISANFVLSASNGNAGEIACYVQYPLGTSVATGVGSVSTSAPFYNTTPTFRVLELTAGQNHVLRFRAHSTNNNGYLHSASRYLIEILGKAA